MISIIVCSISPSRLEELKKNIKATIGNDTEDEVIGFDNRTEALPIAAVYNKCAAIAAGNNLFFLHEDIKFKESGWGRTIEEKLKEEDCGVLGFAGSIIKTSALSGWAINIETERSHYWYIDDNGIERLCNVNMPEGTEFSRVVTLDGCGMAVKKTVHDKWPFDETMLTGFHSYDLDYTMEIAKHCKNYCCHIEVLHMSNGSFDEKWVSSTIRMHNEKWYKFLPLYIPEANFSKKELDKLNAITMWSFFKSAYKSGSQYTIPIFKQFASLPYSLWHTVKVIDGCWKLTVRKKHKKAQK